MGEPGAKVTAFFEERFPSETCGDKALRPHDAASNGTGGQARTGRELPRALHNPSKIDRVPNDTGLALTARGLMTATYHS